MAYSSGAVPLWLINAGSRIPEVNNVAWMGGSLSPPTSAHANVAKMIGEKLATTAGDLCAVCIVPVSQSYNKASVKEECVPNVARLELTKALVQALNAENTIENLRFYLSTQEYDREAPVATVDSLAITQTIFPSAKIYIAQGQDNIEEIFKRKWTRSDELLGRGFIVYPRGGAGADIKAAGGPLDLALQALQSQSKNGVFPPPDEASREKILSRTQVIDVDFNDETSSTGLRKLIREGEADEAIGKLFHPYVFSVFKSLRGTYPGMYKALCGATAGGRRKQRSRRSKNTKRRSRKSIRRPRK